MCVENSVYLGAEVVDPKGVEGILPLPSANTPYRETTTLVKKHINFKDN
jgi:hypothetical protein